MRAAVILTLLLPCLAGHFPGAHAAGGDKDKLTAGGTVRQTEPVPGDFYGFGGDVDVAGPVGGSVIALGGNVRVSGAVGGDVFAGGGNVQVDGVVSGDVSAAGGNVDINSGARIGGNVEAAGGTVNIRGPVAGSVETAAGDVRIDAVISGDVHVAGGTIELGSNAVINGRLHFNGWADVRRHPDAKVLGGEVGTLHGDKPHRRERNRSRGSTFDWVWSLGLIALAALLVGLAPAAATHVGVGMRREPALAFFLGLVVLVCVPAVAVICAITIIGLPVALILLLAYLLMLHVGYATAGVMVGDALLQRLRAGDAARLGWRVGAAAAAALLVVLLGELPLVGWLVTLAALLAGMGAIVIAIADRRAARAAPPSPAP